MKNITNPNAIDDIKLIIFDVDGVLTDGKKTYDTKGQKISKSFGDLDFTAIKILQSFGFKVVWLSGDEVVNEPLAVIKSIPFYCTRLSDGSNQDKILLLPSILNFFSLSKEQVWFVGDDIFDLNIIRNVGFSSCPANASFLVKREVDLVHNSKSGESVASEILELLFDHHQFRDVNIPSILENQNKEGQRNKK